MATLQGLPSACRRAPDIVVRVHPTTLATPSLSCLLLLPIIVIVAACAASVVQVQTCLLYTSDAADE